MHVSEYILCFLQAERCLLQLSVFLTAFWEVKTKAVKHEENCGGGDEER